VAPANDPFTRPIGTFRGCPLGARTLATVDPERLPKAPIEPIGIGPDGEKLLGSCVPLLLRLWEMKSVLWLINDSGTDLGREAACGVSVWRVARRLLTPEMRLLAAVLKDASSDAAGPTGTAPAPTPLGDSAPVLDTVRRNVPLCTFAFAVAAVRGVTLAKGRVTDSTGEGVARAVDTDAPLADAPGVEVRLVPVKELAPVPRYVAAATAAEAVAPWLVERPALRGPMRVASLTEALADMPSWGCDSERSWMALVVLPVSMPELEGGMGQRSSSTQQHVPTIER